MNAIHARSQLRYWPTSGENSIVTCPFGKRMSYNWEIVRSRGPVAQLGARMNGIHEVTGSTPVWSTNLRSPAIVSELRLASPATKAAPRSNLKSGFCRALRSVYFGYEPTRA